MLNYFLYKLHDLLYITLGYGRSRPKFHFGDYVTFHRHYGDGSIVALVLTTKYNHWYKGYQCKISFDDKYYPEEALSLLPNPEHEKSMETINA